MQRHSDEGGLSAVLFTDIVGSTSIASEMGDARWSELVARHHRIVRGLLARFRGREIDTAGDGFFAAFERPADAIRCAAAAIDAVHELGIELRAGVGFGQLETADGKPSGLVVNTAARVMAVAGPAEVLVPASLTDIVPGSGISFEDRGRRRLKGLERDVRLSRVVEVDGARAPDPLDPDEAGRRRREIFPTATSRRLGPLIIGGAIGAVAVVVLLVALAVSRGPANSARGDLGPLRDAVARIDPTTGRPTSVVSLNRQQTALGFIEHPLVAGEGGIWLVEPPRLLHIDPLHADVRPAEIVVPISSDMVLRTGLDAVWVLGGGGAIWRIDPATDERTAFLDLPAGHELHAFTLGVARAVWVGEDDGTLLRIDPRSRERRRIETGLAIDLMTASSERVWLGDVLAGDVVPLDPTTLGRGRPIHISGSLDQLEAYGDTAWVLDQTAGTITRIDGSAGEITGTARVGPDPTDIAVSADDVWVSDDNGWLYRVDTSTLESTRLRIGSDVLGVTVDETDGSIWIYVGEALTPFGS
jgi:class 3 adenylate cyclase